MVPALRLVMAPLTIPCVLTDGSLDMRLAMLLALTVGCWLFAIATNLELPQNQWIPTACMILPCVGMQMGVGVPLMSYTTHLRIHFILL